MKIARKVEYKGQYWAQRTDGTWVRWSALAGEWIEQLAGPPSETFEGPGFAAAAGVPVPALASGIMPGAPDVMDRPLPDMYRATNPVDNWWNREFPPHSKKRLMFFLIALPIVAFLAGLFRDAVGQQEFSWPQYWFVVVGGGSVLALLWLTGSLNPKPDDQEVADQPNVARPSAPRSMLLKDFLITISISFVGVTIMGLMLWPDAALDPATLLTTFGTALGFTIIMLLRRTVWSVIIVSILAGLPCAILWELFFMFLGSGDDFLLMWAIFSVLAFCYFFPAWQGLRKLGFMGGHKEPRLWVLVTGSFILAVASTYFMSWDHDSAARAESAASRDAAPVSSTLTGAATRDSAARIFYSAWLSGSKERAQTVATSAAIEQMFAIAPNSAVQLRGCGTTSVGYFRCAIAFPDRMILLAPEATYNATSSMFYIDFIEKAPLDTPITYQKVEPTPAPTPTH